MFALLAVVALTGPPCGGGYFSPTFCTSAYCPPVVSTPYVAPYVPPVVVSEPYDNFHVVDRVSFAVFEVGNGQQQTLLATLNQQSRTLDAAFKASESRAARLEALLAQQRQPIAATITTPQLPPQLQLPQTTPQTATLPTLQQPSAALEQPPVDRLAILQRGAEVIVNRCSSCHAGEVGRQNKWVLNPAELANPDWRLRIRVQRAVFNSDPNKRMPQGGKLTDSDSQAVLGWGQFADAELAGSPQTPK
jgi:phage-related protein